MTPDTSDREIVNSRTLSHPPQRVFEAFADAAQLAQWWGPKGFTNTFHVFDFRPGGQWSLTMHSTDGHDFKNECVFQEIRQPDRLVIAHTSAPKYVLEVTLAETGGGSGTDLLWVQRFETAEMRDKILKFAGPAAGPAGRRACLPLTRLDAHVAADDLYNHQQAYVFSPRNSPTAGTTPP